MGLLADWQIRKDVKIVPFAEESLRQGVVSFGLSSYGYDVRVGRHFKVFTNVYSSVIDPKHFEPNSFVDIEGDFCVIPPNSFALAETVEYFEIPRDVLLQHMRGRPLTLKRYPTGVSGRFGFYWASEPPFDPADLAERIEKLYGSMSAFFGDTSSN